MVDSKVSEGRAWTRTLVTLAVLAAWRLAALLPLPGLDPQNLNRALGPWSGMALILGIEPFGYGFVIVELFSFVHPTGRKLRCGGIAGRSKLNIYAIRIGFAVALLQAFSIAQGLQAFALSGAR